MGKRKLINSTRLSYIISPPCVNTLLAVRAGLLKRNLNMKLKAKLKWSGEQVFIKPVFFSWHVGLQYKCLNGWKACSIFCDGRNEFIFPLQTEILMLFVKVWYWLRYYVYMQLRYWIPNKIKWALKKQNADDLPF